MEDAFPADCEAEVRAVLAVSGLRPEPDEVAMICAGYPAFRTAVDALYDVAAARYAEPALRFMAEGPQADWE